MLWQPSKVLAWLQVGLTKWQGGGGGATESDQTGHSLLQEEFDCDAKRRKCSNGALQLSMRRYTEHQIAVKFP